MNNDLYSSEAQEYYDDDYDHSAESPDEDEPQLSQPPAPPKYKVAVDWVEFEGALENNSPELRSFLNVLTGDVIRVFDGSEGSDARLRQAEASPDFFYIEPISSREQYRWMEEFIEIVTDPTLKDKLNIAIDGKGAFRRFKDVLVHYSEDRERWFGLRSEKLRNHMTTWLQSKGIEATNTPPWEEGGEEAMISEPRRPRGGEFEARPFRDGMSDLRGLAHELIDLIPPRELPSAVTFLEFLRSRRPGFRRGRYN
jgi:hypothetical protein